MVTYKNIQEKILKKIFKAYFRMNKKIFKYLLFLSDHNNKT
ncbi:MAG: hypothetical protein RLZZ628_1284 [Bacteroidota bacterium]|jgi:hypothetical protein